MCLLLPGHSILGIASNRLQPAYLLQIKCEKYWPDNRETEKHGDLEISCTSSESWADFATHTFSISKVSCSNAKDNK